MVLVAAFLCGDCVMTKHSETEGGKMKQCGTCKFFEPYGKDRHGFCGHNSGWSIFPCGQKGDIRVIDVDGCDAWISKEQG